MSEEFTEVTSESWFSRLGNSIKSVGIGIVLFLIAFPVLFLNEGRAVKRAKSLTEGAGAVVSLAKIDAVDDGNNGKLVHLSGNAATDETLTDNAFGVSAKALRLIRKVEMYQWTEKKSSTKKKKLGGGTETVTRYQYEKKWSSKVVNSKQFKRPDGRENPASMPYESTSVTAKKVTVGAFTLPNSLVSKISGQKQLEIPEQAVSGANLSRPSHVVGKTLYLGTDPQQPQIGDCRITFFAVPPSTVSIIAKQAGSSFEPYHTSAGGTIQMLEMGQKAADQMFAAAEAKNSMLTWILRFVGFIVMAIGIGMVFSPLTVFADVIPILGDILGFGVAIFAAAVAATLSLITISIAWIFYRPLLGVGLLVVGIGIVVACKVLAPKKSQALQSEAA